MALSKPFLLLIPLALAGLMACSASPVANTNDDGEGIIDGKVKGDVNVKVVSVEDVAPKSPRYSPFTIDHGTRKIGSTPTPDPLLEGADVLPSSAPKSSPSPSPTPSKAAT